MSLLRLSGDQSPLETDTFGELLAATASFDSIANESPGSSVRQTFLISFDHCSNSGPAGASKSECHVVVGTQSHLLDAHAV
jgi:hypothetical protein